MINIRKEVDGNKISSIYEVDGSSSALEYTTRGFKISGPLTVDQPVIPPFTNYLYVAKNGVDNTANGSATSPYKTISAAITAASSGTTILILPGTYVEDITFKAGVYLTSTIKFGCYITGNHVVNFSGTIILDNIVLQSTSGVTLTFSGTSSQNLQLLGCSVNSVNGDAIYWTNTNTSSKILFQDGTCNVSTSGASARCVYTSTESKGSFISNLVSFKVDNYDNVCLAIGGAVSFTHTADTVYGQAVISNTASYTTSQVNHVCVTQPVITTNSSGTTAQLECIDTSTSIPIIAGAGIFVYAAVILGSTGKGNASTLNGGLGGIPLDYAPIKFRSGTLRPVPLDGVLEYDGTNLYFTVGSTRKTVTLTT
jgi:hypothetical protein